MRLIRIFVLYTALTMLYAAFTESPATDEPRARS